MTAHPSVGRIVHLNDPFPPYACLAAIVTRVPRAGEFFVDLAVFNRGLDFVSGIAFEESGVIPGTWHWPERVEET